MDQDEIDQAQLIDDTIRSSRDLTATPGRRRPVLRTIQVRVRAYRFQYTHHAKLEMRDDQLTPGEVRDVILKGEVVRTLTRDARGVRHVIGGTSRDGRPVEVVCRLVAGWVRVVTVYVAN